MLALDDAKRLARLSRLALSDGELEALREHLERMVGFVEQLQEIDVTGVEPMTHATSSAAVLREDRVSEECLGRAALRGSAGYEDGLVRVPRVVE